MRKKRSYIFKGQAGQSDFYDSKNCPFDKTSG